VDSDNANYCSVNGILFNSDKTAIVCYPAGKSGSSYTIPDSVTSIGDYAFHGCSALASITIPDGVISIESYVFFGCSALASITIPSSVTSIEWSAFGYCSALAIVYANPTTPPDLGSRAFSGCSALTTIYVPSGCGDAYKSSWADYADYIVEITVTNPDLDPDGDF